MKSLIEQLRMWRWRRTMCGERTTDSGLRFNLRGYDDWLIWHEIFESGEYDQSLAFLCANSKRNSEPVTVLDLGANVGFFVLRLLDYWKAEGLPLSRLKVLSIEPDDKNCFAIEKLRSANAIPKTQWRLIQGLVGKVSGYGNISVGPSHFAHGVMKGNNQHGKKVPYVNLLDSKLDLSSYNYLKIDIEGSEDVLLDNYPSLLKQASIICIETHSAETRERVLRDLKSAGFPAPVEHCLKSASGPLLTTMWSYK